MKELAKLLNVEEKILTDLDPKMARATGRSGVLEKVLADNRRRAGRIAAALGASEFTESTRGELRDVALTHEAELLAHVRTLPGETELDKAAHLAREVAKVGKGFFLKKELAEKILQARPPQHLLAFLKYSSVDELLAHHDVTEAFSALRFMESDEWMHETFDAAYSRFTAADFEEREIELKVLGPEWHEVALKFVEKKHHNVSHLKEFGVIFLNPIAEDLPGKFLRDFALLFHYFHEIEFYSKLFRRYADGADFADNLKSLLRGDVKEVSAAGADGWLIVQRYLSKIDPKDPRLFVPRVNPESLHWRRGEMDLVHFAQSTPSLNLGFWEDLDWVGALLPNGEIASLDMEDNAMAAVSRAEGKPNEFFNYHQREAMWLRIFTEYAGGEAEVERLLLDNFTRGVIQFPHVA